MWSQLTTQILCAVSGETQALPENKSLFAKVGGMSHPMEIPLSNYKNYLDDSFSPAAAGQTGSLLQLCQLRQGWVPFTQCITKQQVLSSLSWMTTASTITTSWSCFWQKPKEVAFLPIKGSIKRSHSFLRRDLSLNGQFPKTVPLKETAMPRLM